MVDMNDRFVIAAMYTLLLAQEKKALFDKGNLDYSAYHELAEANVDLEIMRMARQIREEASKYETEPSASKEAA